MRTSVYLAYLVIFQVAGLPVGFACTTASAGPEPQDACRIGVVSHATHLTSAAGPTPMPAVDRRVADHACRGRAEMGKDEFLADAMSECVPVPDRDTAPQSALEPLDDAALRRTLYDHQAQRDMTGVYDGGGLEGFSSDGTWGEVGGRSAASAASSLGRQVCVVYSSGSVCCRRFFVDSAHQSFFRFVPSPRNVRCNIARLLPLVPVAIFSKTRTTCRYYITHLGVLRPLFRRTVPCPASRRLTLRARSTSDAGRLPLSWCPYPGIPGVASGSTGNRQAARRRREAECPSSASRRRRIARRGDAEYRPRANTDRCQSHPSGGSRGAHGAAALPRPRAP